MCAYTLVISALIQTETKYETGVQASKERDIDAGQQCANSGDLVSSCLFLFCYAYVFSTVLGSDGGKLEQDRKLKHSQFEQQYQQQERQERERAEQLARE